MSLTMQQKADIATEAAKASPPVAVAGATVAGIQVNDLILWSTLVYVVLQIAFLLYRWHKMHTTKKGERDVVD
jgi:hypothetical protein